ncbi:hypothetical protein [Nocardia spumae]|uniref:hypothetical protein n=1 Tax=Nocardia spumae TaxID=2887190 RepID=UPI001D14FA0B|nr:hypothetical protein [Nocardia spumae]
MGGKINGGSGASGIPGGKAIADRLTELAEGVKSPIHYRSGLAARLRYLTKSSAGYDAMNAAGIDVTARTMMAWLAEERTPNAANLARIEAAYTDLHKPEHGRLAGASGSTSNGRRHPDRDTPPSDQTPPSPRTASDLQNIGG